MGTKKLSGNSWEGVGGSVDWGLNLEKSGSTLSHFKLHKLR